MSTKARGLAVIGGGMAAQALIESVREQDSELPITLFCGEGHLPYDRVRLTELVEKGAAVSDLRLRPDEWYADNNIETIVGRRVTGIDAWLRRIYVGDHQREFDKICLATGSEALVLPIEGAGLVGVYLYRYPSDCENILERAEPGKRAVVIGGGLLGLEAAKALAATGCKVTVVHLMDRLMERQLDAEAADLLLAAMKDLDVEVMTERMTVEFLGEEHVEGVRFSTDEVIDCDFVVMSVGITARTDLAREAGIAAERGIVVDDHMRTSADDIFAVGECAQHEGIVYGIVAPIYEQCDVAARAILGREGEPYKGSIPSAKLKVMGIDLVSIGDISRGETVTVSDLEAGVYRKLAVRDGKLTGAVLMGDARGYELLLDAAKTGAEILNPLDTLMQASQATAAELPDTAQVCNCNGVCKREIVGAIREKGLTSTQEVVAVTRAGAGCGSCVPIVSELVQLETGGVDEPKYLCPCRKLTSGEIAESIRSNGAQSVSEVAESCGAGRDCGACKPAISYLVSEINDNRHREERHGRFINDRVHANIQNDGTFSVVPRIYGGVTSPDELRRIADVADKYEVPMVKITGGQRIDLLGIRKEDLPKVWEDLGMPSGHAYAKAVRTVKTCVGERFCRFGLDDSIATGIDLELAWEGVHTPHKVKAAVNGCPRNCAEASTKDIGLIAVEGGWQIRIGGAAGARVREGDILATVSTKAEAMRLSTVFLQHYRENAEYLERTYLYIERVGLDHVKEAVLDDTSGEPERLLERFRLARAAVVDPWLERNDPVHHNQFSELDREEVPA